MGDLRYTTFLVTVGDYDGQETAEQIRRQVEDGVRSRGFMTVDVKHPAGFAELRELARVVMHGTPQQIDGLSSHETMVRMAQLVEGLPL